jgi:hypothetical protein
VPHPQLIITHRTRQQARDRQPAVEISRREACVCLSGMDEIVLCVARGGLAHADIVTVAGVNPPGVAAGEGGLVDTVGSSF